MIDAKSLIFGFVVGGALSGVSAFLLTKSHYEKKIEMEKDEWRNYYKDRYSPKKAAVIKEDPEKIVKEIEEDEYEKIVSNYIYTDPAENESPTEEDDDAPEEYYDDDAIDDKMAYEEGLKAYNYDKDNRRVTPKQITSDIYGTAPGFDAKEISYYVEDDTYVDDETDMVINNPIRIFGSIIKNTRWDEDPNISDDIYIRNFNISCDLKVSKMYCKYYQE